MPNIYKQQKNVKITRETDGKFIFIVTVLKFETIDKEVQRDLLKILYYVYNNCIVFFELQKKHKK